MDLERIRQEAESIWPLGWEIDEDEAEVFASAGPLDLRLNFEETPPEISCYNNEQPIREGEPFDDLATALREAYEAWIALAGQVPPLLGEEERRFNEGDRVGVLRGPHAGETGVVVSASTQASSWVRFDGAAVGSEIVFPDDDLTPLPTAPALEQLISAAKAVGAEGIWLVRGAAAAALLWTERADALFGPDVPSLVLQKPHELVILIRIPVGDGGPGGVEFRT